MTPYHAMICGGPCSVFHGKDAKQDLVLRLSKRPAVTQSVPFPATSQNKQPLASYHTRAPPVGLEATPLITVCVAVAVTTDAVIRKSGEIEKKDHVCDAEKLEPSNFVASG